MFKLLASKLLVSRSLRSKEFAGGSKVVRVGKVVLYLEQKPQSKSARAFFVGTMLTALNKLNLAHDM